MILDLVEQTAQRGASYDAIARVLGLSRRTLERWRATPDADDQRRGPRSHPSALTAEEKACIVAVSTAPENRNLSVCQVVPKLADSGVYLASESSFYRVLRAAGLATHRGRQRPARASKAPRSHTATGPGQVWSWDITYLRSPIRGQYYYLYLVIDVWSRKIVGHAVHDRECMHLASALIERTYHDEGINGKPLVVHADNGGPMKGATMLATLQRLGVQASFSRPSVSDDNAISEALFRTLKYRPGYPSKPFASLEAARTWVDQFVVWYNGVHLHGSLRFVTPNDRHQRRDTELLARRRAVYEAARAAKPSRWSGRTRNWSPIGDVTLNPIRETTAA